MDIGSNVKGWFGRPLAYVGSEWNRMAPRERRLVAGLVAAVVAFAVLVTGFLIIESLRDVAESNEAAREALADIAKHRDEYLEAKDRMMAQEARIGTEPPQFAADLEAAAHEVGIGIPETQEQPSVPAGRRYVEHKVEVKLRQVDLQSLTKFLNKLETGRRLIMVNTLRVRKRFSDQDKLDVDFTATAFERLKEGAKRKPTPAGGKQ
jgi:type II secretory pathway component PulM